ncbi:MAG: hypothetical protein K2X54_02090 [Methylobacterium organophilum]|nr:hypothetical protein [Methylobacterium organophilum]
MARHHFFQADDPTTDDEHYLGVYFTIENPGQEPHGYGEHFDPGCGPEITIVSVQDDIGRHIGLTHAQLDAVEADICARFDFRRALHEEREQDEAA